MTPRILAAAAAVLLLGSPVPAHAAHVWRADRLPLAGDRLAGGGRTATMSVAVDIDANVMRVDFEGDDATSTPNVVRIVGPHRDAQDDGVRFRGELGPGGRVDWKFPESEQSEILGGRMMLDLEDTNGAQLLRGRIERLMDTPDRASTTLLTVLALGFAFLSVIVVTTQRRPEPLA